jgi:hypothetical protein
MTLRSIRAGALVPLMLLTSLATDARAQQAPQTSIGDVVPIATSHVAAPGPLAGPRTVTTMATVALRQEPRTRRWEGAAIGFVAGAVATYFLLHSGGSTSLCDRDANQDAIRARECAGLTALGGVAGGAAGYVIGGRIRVR